MVEEINEENFVLVMMKRNENEGQVLRVQKEATLHGLDLLHRDRNQETLLHKAARHGFIAVVTYLATFANIIIDGRNQLK